VAQLPEQRLNAARQVRPVAHHQRVARAPALVEQHRARILHHAHRIAQLERGVQVTARMRARGRQRVRDLRARGAARVEPRRRSMRACARAAPAARLAMGARLGTGRRRRRRARMGEVRQPRGAGGRTIGRLRACAG